MYELDSDELPDWTRNLRGPVRAEWSMGNSRVWIGDHRQPTDHPDCWTVVARNSGRMAATIEWDFVVKAPCTGQQDGRPARRRTIDWNHTERPRLG